MVLGAHTILKEDHFPGCQSPKLPEVVQGAPNFRGAQGFNVYGSALPTVDGIRRTLEQVNCQPGSQQAASEQVCPVMHSVLTIGPVVCLGDVWNKFCAHPCQTHPNDSPNVGQIPRKVTASIRTDMRCSVCCNVLAMPQNICRRPFATPYMLSGVI